MAIKSSTMMFGPAAIGDEAAPRKGIFARAFDRFVEARMKQGELQVKSYLTKLSDARLQDIGFNPDEIKALRTDGRIPASYWL